MSKWTDFNNWMERNEPLMLVVAIVAIVLGILALTGCASSETRSESRRVLERTETPTGNGGKITIEKERTEEGSETVTKADLTAAIQAGLSALRGDIPGILSSVLPKVPTLQDIAGAVPKPTEQKLLGFTLPEIAAGAGALWTAERGLAVYHKRRRLKTETKP